MAIDGGMFARQLLEDTLDLGVETMRVRLVTGDPGGVTSYLVVPTPPEDEYEPRAGDVWLAGVLRPEGVRVSASVEWTSMGEVAGVVDQAAGRVGDLALFWRVLDGGRPDPFAVGLGGAVWARGFMRVYRAFGGGFGEAISSAAARLNG